MDPALPAFENSIIAPQVSEFASSSTVIDRYFILTLVEGVSKLQKNSTQNMRGKEEEDDKVEDEKGNDEKA